VRTLESWTPRRGLSIPSVTILDPDGRLVEEDQRRLTRYLIQSGRGADIVFANGTTGEWTALRPETRERLLQVVVDEVRKVNGRFEAAQVKGREVEAWVGITAPTGRETLSCLDLALDLGADAAVIAPLAIRDVDDPVRFVQRDIADLLDVRERRIPLFLYDNADIATGQDKTLRTRWVKLLSRLDFVRGIKVSSPPRRLGHYTKAARQFRDLGPFGIYVGNAPYILEMMRPRSGVVGTLVEHWYRFRLRDMLPAGVVAGPANLLPREWQRAWQVACAGDIERMQQIQQIIARFRAACTFAKGRRTLAALKRGLCRVGVTTSEEVAPGTPALCAEDAARFDEALEALWGEIRTVLPDRWCSDPGEADRVP
jgi:dihydrodipicolinate synthase/N-acetylneuraminate lyase